MVDVGGSTYQIPELLNHLFKGYIQEDFRLCGLSSTVLEAREYQL